ncbi:hypothetical protein Pfo_000307 [Paulownia fortunei]|nr:hypothetical protein Pfo_000307 [Paulownia fortunei]
MEGSPPVNQIPSEPAVKRYKFLWRVFLIFNFALGAYMFAQPGKKERGKEKSEAPAEVASIPAAVTAPAQEEPVFSPPTTRPVIVRQPVPEDQQREIFKWMLEEKRKVKPQNREEKQRIDEEKAILKEFIRSKSIPSI